MDWSDNCFRMNWAYSWEDILKIWVNNIIPEMHASKQEFTLAFAHKAKSPDSVTSLLSSLTWQYLTDMCLKTLVLKDYIEKPCLTVYRSFFFKVINQQMV